MDRYYTVMLIPEREKGVRSFHIPRPIFISLSFVVFISTVFVGILGYDYYQVLKQVYENKHLNLENRQLKEQIQLFQMKINTLTDDIQRIHTFEKKLRIITGAPDLDGPPGKTTGPTSKPARVSPKTTQSKPFQKDEEFVPPTATESDDYYSQFRLNLDFNDYSTDSEYLDLKRNYDQKIASTLGLQKSYTFTKEWSELTKQSFETSKSFALFDYKYIKLRSLVQDLEVKIHDLDQFLLDKESFLRSTPTLMPTKGWITSYYGPRKSPYSGRLKMHEGLDIGAKRGTAIVAPADGIITYAGRKASFGNFVQIDHGYGVETVYGHAQKVLAKKGQKVKRGTLVATVGNTGLSTGPHLHYEVRVNDIAVDPMYFILD